MELPLACWRSWLLSELRFVIVWFIRFCERWVFADVR